MHGSVNKASLGHFIFECKSTRPYVSRPSRTELLENPRLLAKLKAEGKPSVEVPEEFRRKYVSTVTIPARISLMQSPRSGTANRILEAKELERQEPERSKGKAKEEDEPERTRKKARRLLGLHILYQRWLMLHCKTDLQGRLPQIVQTRSQIQGLVHLTALSRVQELRAQFPGNVAGSDRGGVVHLQSSQSLHLVVGGQELENEHSQSVDFGDGKALTSLRKGDDVVAGTQVTLVGGRIYIGHIVCSKTSVISCNPRVQ